MSVRRFADRSEGHQEPLQPLSERSFLIDVAPSPKTVEEELNQDFGNKVEQQKKLSCNWKMALGIMTGVLVGVAVLTLVLLAIAGTHGGAAILLPILGHKAFAALGVAHAYVASATASAAHALGGGAALTKALTVLFPAVLFLGGGSLGGKLFRKGELEQIDKMLGTSQAAFQGLESRVLGRGNHLSERDIERVIAQEESTVMSSRVGKSFIELKRRAALHYRGWGDRIAKAFGHFWTAIPLTTVGALTSAPSYYRGILASYDREHQLKLDSVRDRYSLQQLNDLRAVQVEQAVWLTDAMGNAYSKVPELLIYDRQIAKLKALRNKTDDVNLQREIDQQMTKETQKKIGLMQARLSKKVQDQIFSSAGPIRNLLTIKEDIERLEGLDDEKRGQILEAVSIFLGQNTGATIEQVNRLVSDLAQGLMPIDAREGWKTRKYVMEYAQKFGTKGSSEAMDGEIIAVESLSEQEKQAIQGAMLQTRNSLIAKMGLLAVADVASGVIHATPIPGSSAVAGGVTGGAVAVSKGWGLAAVRRRLFGT